MKWSISLLRKSSAFLLLLLISAGSNQPQSQTQVSQDTSLASIVARAYSMLRVNSPDAERYFEKAVIMDPSNVLIRKQLGYLYLSEKKNDLALAQFQAADSLQPSDSTKLQIAYILIRSHRQADADHILNALQSSTIPDIRERALSVSYGATSSLWWTRFYGVSYYDTRWSTSFFQLTAYEGYHLTDDQKVSAYGFVSLSGDARSSGGLSPAIFSDNALVMALGVRVNPFTGLQVHVQEGASFDLIDRSNIDFVRNDFRAIAIYGYGMYAPYSFHDDVRTPFYPTLDLYSSLGYYSRYKNTIGYLQVKGGLRSLEVSSTVADVYALVGFAKDSEKEYYNNIIEGGFGARITPNVHWGLYLVAEVRRGYYVNLVTATPLPYDRYYGSARFYVIFDRTF
ncbi:MAG: hypothetical protein HYR76_00180 [Ignavibacteria bacterium]|nr:hypothetical protein [Ignavibacteria bacterium]MBI3765230.1 hypothetical protein [Ignavibacteriales bacterium]